MNRLTANFLAILFLAVLPVLAQGPPVVRALGPNEPARVSSGVMAGQFELARNPDCLISSILEKLDVPFCAHRRSSFSYRDICPSICHFPVTDKDQHPAGGAIGIIKAGP